MSFHPYDRYQAHCRKCFKIFEEDSVEAACESVAIHERNCGNKPAPAAPQKTLSDAVEGTNA